MKKIIGGVIIFTAMFFLPSIVNAAPANPTFTDDEFYACVVDNYNKENDTDYGYDTNLTDEQLESIQSLYCVSEENVLGYPVHTFVNTIFKQFYNRYNNRTVLTLELTFVLKSIFQKCCLVNSCINNRMKPKENACIYKRPFKRKTVNTSVITCVYTIMLFDSRIPEGNTFRG